MGKVKFVKILLLASVIFLLSFTLISWKKLTTHKFSFSIQISKGENLNQFYKNLCEKKIISNCLLGKVFFKLHQTNNIKPGFYEFSEQTLQDIIKQLKEGPKITYVKFTILPGYTKFDIAKKLNTQQRRNFLNLITNKDFITKMQKKYPELKKFGELSSLEGFLYPDTYFFKKSDLKSYLFPQLLIKTSVKNFANKTKKLSWKNAYNLSPYEILILASIVEKEEPNIKNKPLVANILIKRYKNNWTVGADWTLCYGLKISSNRCYQNLTYKNLNNKENPYNTRTNKGLPPTPVSNPTVETIKATINSKPNPYWYYLHDKNGKIHFAKTANKHFLNKNTYLR